MRVIGLLPFLNLVYSIKTPKTAETSKYPWTPLDEYVWREDNTFSWSLVSDEIYSDPQGDGDVRFVVLNVTTQSWLTPETFTRDHDCHVWWHFVHLSIPLTWENSENNLLEDSAFVLIGSGNWEGGPQSPESEQARYVRKLALSTNSIGISIRNVPYQRCTFSEDPQLRVRSEDEIIAWTWRKFIDNPELKDYPLRNPMTKSVVKVMDAVEEFVYHDYGRNLERFCVTGASKRGWTSWTVAAVDYERVKCTMPMMMDTLNLVPTLHNHYRSLGNWTVQFLDYYELGILADIDTEAVQKLAGIIDGYTYRERYGDHFCGLDHNFKVLF